jgi:hypothetical protein
MKKKILLFLLMFMFMTNVSALTFDVDITNIEDKGNNGTIGQITNINQENREIEAFFQDIGDEVSFAITITNTGDRAGTLREIIASPGNSSIEYTSDLPDGGLAINGNDTNVVIITAKVKEGAQNGRNISEVKIKYSYDEGSCPDGEILSEDESMCLCPEGMERNETGVCVKPEKEIKCADDEIYNSEKKICEKKVVPVNPSNPKTLDNIILITLLFFVSGLGIYAVMFRRLKTKKKRITVGVITGVLTLSLSFTVLAGVFGLDKLIAAIVNPITKSKELVVTVKEKIDLIETWDGTCDLADNELTPDKIFQGGSGTESDPYQIKTAEQLSCFAKSVNEGNAYEGKFIKQTKNIKLNDKVLENVEAGTTNNLNTWTPIGTVIWDNANGIYVVVNEFKGSYDGDNKTISGIYINDSTAEYVGLFSVIEGATIKNLTLSDNYVSGKKFMAILVGFASINDDDPVGSTIDNVKTYGKVIGENNNAGIISTAAPLTAIADSTRITNSENYADVTSTEANAMGIAYTNVIIINGKNYGNITAVHDVAGICGYNSYVIDSENHGEIVGEAYVSGIGRSNTIVMSSDNYGNIIGRTINGTVSSPNGYIGISSSGAAIDCNNYGDIETNSSNTAGIVYGGGNSYNCGNTGKIYVHDNTTTVSSIYVAALNMSGSPMMDDADLANRPYLANYQTIMGKEFVSRNQNSYNSGDIYVENINVTGSLSVNMTQNSGCSKIINTENTGNMYISNINAKYGSFMMIGTDGSTNRNVVSEGDMIIDNFTGEQIVVGGVALNGSSAYDSSSSGTIEVKNSALGIQMSDWAPSRSFIAGGTSFGGYMENTYITGEIKVHDNDFRAGLEVGNLTGDGAGATRSYSEKSIEVYGNSGTTLEVANLATGGGRGITDSYNKGNINVHDNAFDTLSAAGGTTGGMSFYGGNYNAGDIYVKDNYATSIGLSGGGMSGPFFNNYYNYGDITFETENNTRLTSLTAAGINTLSHGTTSNLVNAGNITIPYVSTVTNLNVGGAFASLGPHPSQTNVYNIGTISIADGYTYSDDINYGNVYSRQITTDYDATGVTPGAYYTQDGYAMGLSRTNTAYRALDANYGTKINASQAPNVLDIINVNNAFEIKQGEELPTLKVFNQ